MTYTRHKLEEASFFLTKLNEHYYDDLRNLFHGQKRAQTFAFFLSAFVSAARSVAWVMKSEYIRASGWKEWYEAQTLSDSDRQLLKLFNDLRVRSEKSEPLLPGHSFRLVGDPDAPEKDPRLPQFRITVRSADEGDDRVFRNGEVAAWTWTLDEFDGKDLLPACRRYLELLSSLVNECELRFTCPEI